MRNFVGLLAVLVVTACSEPQNQASVTVTDSAGVAIVTNQPDGVDSLPRYTLSAEPVLELGAEAGEAVTFFRITAVAPLPDGGVVVGSSRPAEVRVFLPDGSPGATLGRPGEGPGEFWTVTSVVPFADDSIAIWDQNRRRLSVFSHSGELLRERGLGDLVLPSPETAGNVLNPAASNYLLPAESPGFFLLGVGAFGPGSGVRRVGAPSLRISASGQRMAAFGPFPGMQSYLDENGVAPYPFATNLHGVTIGDTLVIGAAEEEELRFFGPLGGLIRIVRWPGGDRTVAGPRLERWIEWLDTQLGEMPPPQAALISQIFEAMPQAERFPAYGDLLATDTGELWVGQYPGQLGLLGLPGAPPRMPARRWQVFRVDGILSGQVTTPEGFEPHAIYRGRVWGVFTDELDVESVRAYNLERTAA